MWVLHDCVKHTFPLVQLDNSFQGSCVIVGLWWKQQIKDVLNKVMPLILISLQHQAWIYANLQLDTILQKEKWRIHHPFPHNGLMLYKKQLVHSVLDSCMPSWLRLCSWWGIQAACEKYRGGVWLPTYFGSRKYCIRPQNPAVWCISLKVLHLGCCEQA